LKKEKITNKAIFNILSNNENILNEISNELNVSKNELKKYLNNIVSDSAEIYIDGGSRGNPGDAGIGIVIDYKGKKTGYYEFLGVKTNNEAEYTSLIRALQILTKNKIFDVNFYSDSELICNQINGNYKVKNERIIKLYDESLRLIKKLKYFKIEHIKRVFNKEADKLVNIAIDKKNKGKIEFAVTPHHPSPLF